MKYATAALALACAVLPVLSGMGETSGGGNGGRVKKVLFVYDVVDERSGFYIDAFRKALAKTGHDISEVAVEKGTVEDISSYDVLVVYSRVMAFNMMSPVRKWLKKHGSFKGRKLFLYVTADRLFHKAHCRGLIKLVKKREGVVIDAVTMATNKMSDEDKVRTIGTHLQKLTD